ncbi:MAG: HIT family protein [Ilumatobacteraceae bacterium]
MRLPTAPCAGVQSLHSARQQLPQGRNGRTVRRPASGVRRPVTLAATSDVERSGQPTWRSRLSTSARAWQSRAGGVSFVLCDRWRDPAHQRAASHLDEYWQVGHCHPVAVAGWLVLVLRRHARALHELTEAESASLGRWLPAVAAALHEATQSEVEYVMQFAEGQGFHHVHFHIIGRTVQWNPAWIGPRVWGAFGAAEHVGADVVEALINAVGESLGVVPKRLDQ